jgi:tRNA pseudouridine55 synthase
MVSAIKRDGTPLYVLARRGVTVPREPRRILVRELSLLAYRGPVAEFEVICSKGTYVRTLAHDVGRALGCGAHLGRLARRRVGSFRIEDALSLDDVSRAGRDVGRIGLSMFDACSGWPSVRIDPREVEAIATGTPIELDATRLKGVGGLVRVTADGVSLAAVGRADGAEGSGGARTIRPVRVFVEPA